MNGRERARTLRTLAMQKVEGSSPFIRSESSCKSAGLAVFMGNDARRVARFVVAFARDDMPTCLDVVESREIIGRCRGRKVPQLSGIARKRL